MALFFNKIDAKGRIFVPAKVRDKLGKRVYVAPNPQRNYLSVYSEARFEKLNAEFESLPMTSAKVRKARRMILGEALECETDGQGRISVSAELWDRIGALPTMEIAIYQIGDMMEICTKDFYDEEKILDKENGEEIDLEGLDLTAL